MCFVYPHVHVYAYERNAYTIRASASSFQTLLCLTAHTAHSVPLSFSHRRCLILLIPWNTVCNRKTNSHARTHTHMYISTNTFPLNLNVLPTATTNSYNRQCKPKTFPNQFMALCMECVDAFWSIYLNQFREYGVNSEPQLKSRGNYFVFLFRSAWK